jgi:hypothetical protein
MVLGHSMSYTEVFVGCMVFAVGHFFGLNIEGVVGCFQRSFGNLGVSGRDVGSLFPS